MIENSSVPTSSWNYCQSAGSACNRLYNRFQPYKTLVSDGYYVLWYAYKSNPKLLDQTIELVSHSFPQQSSSWNWTGKVCQVLRIIPLVSAPFAMYAIGREGRRVIQHKNVTESALKMTEAFAWLGDSVSAGLNGAAKLSYIDSSIKISSAVAKAALGVSVASTILWLSSVALHARGWYKSSNILKRFEQTTASNPSSAEAGFKILEDVMALDNREIRTTFNMKGKDLRTTLQKIKGNAEFYFLEGKPEEVNETLRIATESLKKRASDKIFSHKLGIACGIIGAIGMMVLLFLATAVFVPYGLLLVGVIFSIANTLYEKRSVTRCEEALKRCADEFYFPKPQPQSVRQSHDEDMSNDDSDYDNAIMNRHLHIV